MYVIQSKKLKKENNLERKRNQTQVLMKLTRELTGMFVAVLLFLSGYAFLFVKFSKVMELKKVLVRSIFPGRNAREIYPEPDKPKLLCWIMADPHLLNTKVIHQKNTWARKCDKLLVMSSVSNDSFPAIGMNVSQGKQHIAAKVKAAWTYIHKYYISDFDFFIKTDPDTYLVVENLRDFLKDKDLRKPHYFGHRYVIPETNITFMAGGPGLLITRESLNRLVTQAFVKYPECIVDGKGEDFKVCKCLTLVGCEAQDTRDSEGKERFLVFPVSSLVFGIRIQWYLTYDVNGAQKGSQCCSDYPIAFHYIKPSDMYTLEYWLYHAKVKGLETQKVPWPKIDPVKKSP